MTTLNSMVLAHKIRANAAKELKCKVSDIDFSECLKMAHKRIKYRSINNERTNLFRRQKERAIRKQAIISSMFYSSTFISLVMAIIFSFLFFVNVSNHILSLKLLTTAGCLMGVGVGFLGLWVITNERYERMIMGETL